MTIRMTMLAAIAVASGLVAGASRPARADDGQTAAALRSAYQRETAAQRHYLDFSTRASHEGQTDAATLFLALETAEGVHARAIGRVLEEMGVTPLSIVEPVAVGSTADNLRASIDTEVLERSRAYPQFMGCARAELLYDALAAFRIVRTAEASHANLSAAALDNLDRAMPAHAYFVCPGCGTVRTALQVRACACGTSAAQSLAFESPAVLPRAGLLVAMFAPAWR